MTSLLKMTGSFSIQSQRVSLPCTAHSHEFLEVAYVEKGWATHTLNGVSRRLNAGAVVLVDFGEVHSYDSGSSDLTVVNCLFQPGLLDTSLIHCRSFPVLLNSCMPGMGEGCAAFGGKGKIFHDRKGEILAVLRRLQREFSNQDAGYDAMIRLLLWQLVIHSVRLIGIQVPRRPEMEVSWVLEEIRKNPAAPHSLTEYARRFSMRPEGLSRMFLAQTGEKYGEHLYRKRMELACRLLLETRAPVSEIGEQCGYQDAKSFREAFRRMTGQSPREYRKNASAPLLHRIHTL